ncbi:hypothetical protein F3J20_07345 [Paraburkholderia sp. Cy-641]|nr:hypothetical protein [Paraburkholderia sp. Cy-641]
MLTVFHVRDRCIGTSRNVVEPTCPTHASPSVDDEWAAQLASRLRADRHRPKRDRRTARFMFEAIRDQGDPNRPRARFIYSYLRADRSSTARLSLVIFRRWAIISVYGSAA